MDKIKLAVILIVKGTDDEATLLQNCLNSVEAYADGIFININSKDGQKPSQKVIDVADSFTNNVILTTWKEDFAKARNENLAQVPNYFTHVMWLDTDDTVDKPHKIKEVLAAAPSVDCLFVDYEYDHDEDGNPTTVHLIGRIIKNNGSHKWKGSIHETLIETRGVNQGSTRDFKVVHHASGDRIAQSYARNIAMLEAQLENEGDEPDPRTFYYLGCTYIDAGNAERAKELLANYLILSGWDQERSQALTKLGNIHLSEGNTTEAKRCFAVAIAEDPDNPEPRVNLGSLELELQQYHKARRHLEYVETMEKDLTTLERNPMSYTLRTHLLLVDTYVGLGGKFLDKAVEQGEKALKYTKNKDIKKYVKTIKKVVEDKSLLENFATVARALKKNKQEAEIKFLLEAVPKQLDDNPLIVQMRNQNGPFTWPEKSVVIFTGDTVVEKWGPWSLKEGVGGSEEAVIRLSQHLRDLGYKVVVYGKPSERAGEYDGVQWRNFWEVNLDDNYDIFIGWRNPALFDRKIKSRKSYLWLHDVMEKGEFTEERLANLDRVMVLSDYHRSLFPMIPDKKIFLTANGIDPADFEKEDGKHKRDPHKLVYMSSHVRGLAYLYKIWPDIKKAVPEATLDVFYGRETYDAVHKGNPERMQWMDGMQKQAKDLDGVTDHGKISQDRIVQEIFKSAIWPYPCPWPEIYAITAMKAQAGGAIPVTTDYAALAETVQFGYKHHVPNEVSEFTDDELEIYKEKLIWWMTHPEEQEKIRGDMMAWARTNSWRKVAEDWDRNFSSEN